MHEDQACANRVIAHINTEIRAGRKTGDFSIYTICSRNIFESMLYGQYSPTYPVVLETVKQHFQNRVAIKIGDNFTYVSNT